MKYEFVKLKMKNNPPSSAYLEGYKDIIEKYAKDGYSFVNWLPVKQGASGKILEIELIFAK